MKRIPWTREAILAEAGIKAIEWPSGWHLWGPPDYKVSKKAQPQPKARKKARRG